MKPHLSLIPIGLLLLTVSTPARDRVKRVRLEGLDVTMTLKRRKPAPAQAAWPAERITLTAQSVAVNGKTIHEILKRGHIFPDVEAFAVVYKLNPEVKRLSGLDVPQLRVPVIRGGPKLNAAFGRGFAIYLTADKGLKDKFGSDVKRLTRLTQAVSAFEAEKFQHQSAAKATIASLQNISDILTQINNRLVQRFGRPIPTEALRQLSAEVALLNRALGGKSAPGARISADEQEQVAAVEKDVSIKKSAYVETAAGGAPDRWPEVIVMVRTLRGRSEISSLRIYYVPMALKGQAGEVQSFGVLSSPSSQSLPEADYCFWAGKDPDRTAVTGEQCLEVRTNRRAEVQLTVTR